MNAGPRPEFGDIARMMGEAPEEEPQAQGYRASLVRALALMDKAKALREGIEAKLGK